MKNAFILSLLLAVSGTLAARITWHAPSAAVRIRFNVLNSRQANLLVPIPEELFPRDLVAYDDKGIIIPATPIHSRGKIIAAAIDAHSLGAPLRKDNYRPNASLYLLPVPSVQRLPYAGKPVQFLRTVADITTRAYTGSEMMRLFANLHLLPYPQGRKHPVKLHWQEREEASFGALRRDRHWYRFRERKHSSTRRALVAVSATFLVSQACSWRFGTDQPQVAWAVLLDTQPVADWFTADSQGMGPLVHLSPGLHTIQLLVEQSMQQPLPVLLHSPAGSVSKPTELASLLPSHTPQVLRLDFRDGEHLSTDVECRHLLALAFHHLTPPALVDLYQVTAPGRRCQFLDVQGVPGPLPAANLLATGRARTPAFRITAAGKSYTFPSLLCRWHPCQAASCDVRLKVPSVIPQGVPLPLSCQLTVPPELPINLHKLLKLSIIQTDGKQRETVLYRQRHDLPGPSLYTLVSGIRPVHSTLHITAQLGSVSISSSRCVDLLTPSQASCHLRASGTQLFHRDHHATLLAPPAASVLSSPAVRSSAQSVLVIDDFLLTSIAPGADLLPASPDYHWLPLTVPPGTQQRLAVLSQLSRILAHRPQRALFLVNVHHLLAHPSHWDAQMRFIIPACRLLGIQPELILPPDTAGITSRSGVQHAAYQAKILAHRLSVPLLDLQTQCMLQDLPIQSWKTAYGLPISTLNNQARALLFNLIK